VDKIMIFAILKSSFYNKKKQRWSQFRFFYNIIIDDDGKCKRLK